MKQIYFKNLERFRKKIKISSAIENKEINYVLRWLEKKNTKNRMKVKKINVDQLKDWNNDGKGNLLHKSKQFFGIEGIKVSSASGREVSFWDQPIMTQKHGGILAILTREKENGIVEFLLCARKEPGDIKLKLCPSFSATQSNINLAHGGKKTPLSNLVIGNKRSNLIGKTIHFEEGARFWRKSNQNLLLKIDKKDQLKINNSNFIWLNLSQIKKLNLVDGIINPFVKTILFMI
tara:strand:- start:367 stop:1068 length:702 start_codon:yes stop_codon:yes gene_type:complete